MLFSYFRIFFIETVSEQVNATCIGRLLNCFDPGFEFITDYIRGISRNVFVIL